jgi:hypothetical protein
MDAPRRWQVASLATAVAGLGLGSLMVGRSPSVEVEPIDLDAVTVSSTSDEPTFRLPLPDPPEIVVPRVREDQLSPDTPLTASAESPAEPTAPSGPSEVQQPAPTAPAAPAAPADSVDSADPDDSVDEVDPDGSVESADD